MMNRRTATRIALTATILIAGAGLISANRAADDDFFSMRKNFEIFGSMYEDVVGTYVMRVDPERFMRAGMESMMETLDPWTVFIDEADRVAIDLRSRRMIGDVGINIGRQDGSITVLVPDGAIGAYRQGIRTGDVIVLVDGQTVDSLTVPDVHGLLRGDPGSVVEVRILRDGHSEMEFSLLREAPKPRSVSFAEPLSGEHSDILYIKLDKFDQRSGNEVREAIQSGAEAGPLSGIILDLRDNPGGLVDESVEILQSFLPKGSVAVSMRGRLPEMSRVFSTDREPVAGDTPLVLLVNRHSASASEIVAGAIQDHDRGVIIGEPTFGKGLVQTVRALPFNTAIKVTIARYYTPSGRGIRQDGLEGDAGPRDEFRTASGRLIREGYGIEPEISSDMREAGPLEKALDQSAAFFRFAGVLVDEHRDALEAAARIAGRIELPSDAREAFRRWLDDVQFEYVSPFQQSIVDLDLDASGEAVRSAFQSLQTAAQSDAERAFDEEADRIESRLRTELAARLLGPEERVRAGLAEDAVLEMGIDVLRDAGRRESLLAPNAP